MNVMEMCEMLKGASSFNHNLSRHATSFDQDVDDLWGGDEDVGGFFQSLVIATDNDKIDT
jgi:hypothetical protein